MSTAADTNGGCAKTLLYLLLGGTGLWLGWHALRWLYYTLSYAGANAMLALDLSAYGQLTDNHWPGYVLLGLGLGAAGGAVAAQRRFGLARAVAVGGWAAIVLLLAIVYATVATDNPAEDAALNEPSDVPVVESHSVESISTTPTEPAPTIRSTQADTSSTVIEGQLQVAVRAATLRTSWLDSLASPAGYLNEGDTVRLRRQMHGWVQVVAGGGHSGWIRLAELGSLKEAPDNEAPEPTIAATDPAPPRRETPTKPVGKPRKIDHDSSSGTAANASVTPHLVGHQQHTGQVGGLPLTLALDWQPNGELSGSCYYNQQPITVYRLTGSIKASGELHLLVFKRGQVAAKCVLQRQDDGYAGTMFNADGQQLPMRLE